MNKTIANFDPNSLRWICRGQLLVDREEFMEQLIDIFWLREWLDEWQLVHIKFPFLWSVRTVSKFVSDDPFQMNLFIQNPRSVKKKMLNQVLYCIYIIVKMFD